jgi:glycerol-3-phosphate dehydrogenase
LSSEVLNLLGLSRKVSTESLPIGGGAGFPESDNAQIEWARANANTVSQERAKQLLNRYGTLATEVISYIAGKGQDQALKFCPDYSVAEIGFIVDHESVVHLSDLVHRRTSLAFVGGLSDETLSELAEIVGKHLGWGPAQTKAEIESIYLEIGVGK